MPQTTPTPCSSKPFIRLAEDNSNAPILDYNLPQKSCLPLYSFMPLRISSKYLKKEALVSKPNLSYQALKGKPIADIKAQLLQDIAIGKSELIDNVNLITQSAVPVILHDTLSKSNVLFSHNGQMLNVVATKGNVSAIKQTTSNIAPITDAMAKKVAVTPIQELSIPKNLACPIDIHLLAEKLVQGYKPVVYKHIDGKPNIQFIPYEIQKPVPQFYIKFELMQCSYLSQYGAGHTVGTFSLLPGEKTTIAINSYMHKAEQISRSQNIIDSISEASINSYENALINENATSSETSTSSNSVDPGRVTTVKSGWIFSPIVKGETTNEAPTTSTSTLTHLANITSTVESALSSNVNSSNAFREMQVNTSSIQETEFGTETSIIREIENINLSRTLNFVFRQLLQKYTTLLWLKNIKIGFSYGNTTTEVNIHSLQELLESLIVADKIEEVKKLILKPISTIFNYEQKPFQYIECKKLTTIPFNCACKDETIEKETICIINKVQNLTDTYDNITVKGIILNATEQVLKTPSIIVDALLGQGEALDCYNTHTQQENITAQQLKNEQTKQAIAIINGFETPEDKAKNYKLVFGDFSIENKES